MTPFLAGLDLGQQNDPSVLAVAERKDIAFNVRHLFRWELATSYPKIIDDIAKLYSKPPLAGSVLVLDATGVGRPVLDGLHAKRLDAHIVPVIIHSGFQTSRTRGCVTVPKSDLVGALRMLLGTGRIKISPKLPLAKTCQRELENFTLKVSEKGLESYGNADSTTHDDLVIALALLGWYGCKRRMDTPLRTFTLKSKAEQGRCIFVCPHDCLESLPIDRDFPTAVLDFSGTGSVPGGKLCGRHAMPCQDKQPDEVGVWTEEDQAGLLSVEQCKAMWLWLIDPGVKDWRQLVVIDNGGTDRRALSAALSIADVMRIPRSALVMLDDPEGDIDNSDLEPDNAHIYQVIRRGRYHLAA